MPGDFFDVVPWIGITLGLEIVLVLIGLALLASWALRERSHDHQTQTNHGSEEQQAIQRVWEERVAHATVTSLDATLASVHRHLERPRVRRPIYGPPPISQVPQPTEPMRPGLGPMTGERTPSFPPSMYEPPIIGWHEFDDPAGDSRTTNFTIEERPGYSFSIDAWLDGIEERGSKVSLTIYEDGAGLFHATLPDSKRKLVVTKRMTSE